MEYSLGIILSLVIGGVFSSALVWLVFSRRINQTRDEQNSHASLVGRLKEDLQRIESQRSQLQEKLESELVMNARLKERNLMLEQQMQEASKDRDSIKNDFKILADEVLKNQSNIISERHHKELSEILNPLKEKINAFEKRVESVHESNIKNRSELLGQVKQLTHLSEQVKMEANQLSQALKGDSKKQGAWGEFILERILENSGLAKGREYELQYQSENDGVRQIPDAVIMLPENKFVVVDAKVSLKDFELFVNAQDAEKATVHLNQHVKSVRNHIKMLSNKTYQHAVKGKTLDFVLMFLPVEAGFAEALKRDPDIYQYAWQQGIVLVSPTTLLATLRTIATVWRQEKQNKNVVQIAIESGKLYDKFVAFIQDFEKIKRGLDGTMNAYESAYRRLATGKGNLIKRAEHIKTLGATTTKSIDANISKQD